MYKSILVPLDGSEYALLALRHAADLAKGGEHVTLVSVIPPVDLIEPKYTEDVEKSQDMLAREAYDEERAAATRFLSAASDSLAKAGVETSLRILEGTPAEQILEAARETGADLIVITAYGKSASSTPSKTGVFGKVADAVLKGAHVAVLVIKPW
jgi:nucleotide-binding universal stress UspA family protein